MKLTVKAVPAGDFLSRLEIYNGNIFIGEYERSQAADIGRKDQEIQNAADLLLWIFEKYGQPFVVRWDGLNRRKSVRVNDSEVCIIPRALREQPSWER